MNLNLKDERCLSLNFYQVRDQKLVVNIWTKQRYFLSKFLAWAS